MRCAKDKTEQETDDQIRRVISTYMADNSLIKAVKNSDESLMLTQSFRNQRGKLLWQNLVLISGQLNSLKQQVESDNLRVTLADIL